MTETLIPLYSPYEGGGYLGDLKIDAQPTDFLATRRWLRGKDGEAYTDDPR